jgi:hypothetical protein
VTPPSVSHTRTRGSAPHRISSNAAIHRLRIVAAPSGVTLYRPKLKLKANFESSSSHISFQALSSRQFQLGFDRVKLHRPTMPCPSCAKMSAPARASTRMISWYLLKKWKVS